METENKIIKAFLKRNESMTIREISRQIKADYKITHTAITRLIQKKIISLKPVGGSSLCSLNLAPRIEILEAEDGRKKHLLKNKDISQLFKEITAKAHTGFFVLIVFGSYASGTHTKGSDIDLMFVSNEKGFEKKIDSILSLLPLQTHALVFNETEFKRMLYSKEPNVVKEAVKCRVVLYGSEIFYRLIGNLQIA